MGVPWTLEPEHSYFRSCCKHCKAGENPCEAQTVPPREMDGGQSALHGEITMSSSGSSALCRVCPGLCAQADFGGLSGGQAALWPCSLGQGTQELQTLPPPTVSGQGCT